LRRSASCFALRATRNWFGPEAVAVSAWSNETLRQAPGLMRGTALSIFGEKSRLTLSRNSAGVAAVIEAASSLTRATSSKLAYSSDALSRLAEKNISVSRTPA
jgi:hypothetical protein